jgi:hypothetical protein
VVKAEGTSDGDGNGNLVGYDMMAVEMTYYTHPQRQGFYVTSKEW